ncbi:MAG: signal peptidase I [Archangiaceae bacterium]|nr:signal peptidase I [Archangiaceae bacterium]
MSTVADAVKAKLQPADLQALRKTRWLDRLTSLWAPISIFGIAFSIYLVIVEFSVCSYPGLQPWLQGFGLIMLAYYLGLVGLRAVAKGFMVDRKRRAAAEELIAEVEALAAKNAQALAGKPTEELAERLVALARALGLRTGPEAPDQGQRALSESADKHLKKFKRGSAGDFAGGFVKALLVALLIRSVLVEPFKIPSGSMIPTLEIGDQIFVNKFIYGVRMPFLNFVPFQIVRAPRRGDVIVFNNRLGLRGKDFIKRIISVPGDHLEVHGATVKVNGEALPTTVENPDYPTWEMPNCDQARTSVGRQALRGSRRLAPACG